MLNKKLFCRHRSESGFPRFILAKRGQAAKQKRRGAARIIVVFHTRSKRNLLYSRAAITMLTKRGFPSRPSLGFSFSIAQNPRSCNWTFIICAALRHVVLMRVRVTKWLQVSFYPHSSISCAASRHGRSSCSWGR